MIKVSLIKLVLVRGAWHLWPEPFRDLVRAAEENPDDRIRFGVIADWCDENDESVLGHGWRWLFNRAEQAKVTVSRRDGEWSRWSFRELPDWIRKITPPELPFDADNSTLAALVADLALRLETARREIS